MGFYIIPPTSVGEATLEITIFESIAAGTAGTVTLPTGATIRLDAWAAGVDALVSTMSGGRPEFRTPEDAGGNAVTATLNAAGAWTLSAAPTAYPVGLIYVVRCTLENYNLWTAAMLDQIIDIIGLHDLPAATAGDVIYANAEPRWEALAHPGAANRVLQSSAALVQWSGQPLVLTTGLTNQGGAGVLNWGGAYTLTIPATGTAAIATGIAGGQTWYGGTAANDDLTLHGTSNATRTTSYVIIQPSGGYTGVGTSTPSGKFHVHEATAATDVEVHISQAGTGNTANLYMGNSVRDWRLFVNTSGEGYRFQVDYVGTDAPKAGIIKITRGGLVGFNTAVDPTFAVDIGSGGLGLAPTETSITSSTSGTLLATNSGGAYPFDSAGNLIIASRTNSQRDILLYTGNAANTPTIRAVVKATSGYVGLGGVTSPGAQLHVDQSSATAAVPVLTLDQADVDVVLAKVIGTAAAASADRTLVADSDFGTPGALVGWIQVEIQDDGNRVADGDYYVPFYAVPT